MVWWNYLTGDRKEPTWVNGFYSSLTVTGDHDFLYDTVGSQNRSLQWLSGLISTWW
jgi:hypothetical protein